MIIKPRDIPTRMLQLEAIDRRLPPHHKDKQYISDSAQKLRAGYNGEKSIDFPLSFLPKNKYRIFHTLRIPDENGLFQIDTLILSKNFALIIETKNIFGTVTFDRMGQVIRKTEEKEEGFNNPILQVNLQHLRFRRWLLKHHFPAYPLEKIVVYANTRTILKNISNNTIINDMVMHKDHILTKIEQLSETYSTPSLQENEIIQLSNLLIEGHHPERFNALEKYQISVEELLKGVICPACNALPMQRVHGKWQCGQCGSKSKNAHLQALEDYRMLISNTINNRQARDFLLIKSANVVKTLLQSAGFEWFGTTSARKYKLEKRL